MGSTTSKIECKCLGYDPKGTYCKIPIKYRNVDEEDSDYTTDSESETDTETESDQSIHSTVDDINNSDKIISIKCRQPSIIRKVTYTRSRTESDESLHPLSPKSFPLHSFTLSQSTQFNIIIIIIILKESIHYIQHKKEQNSMVVNVV